MIILIKMSAEIKQSTLVCPQHQLPLEIVCPEDNSLLCFECANSPPHQAHESKLKVADFTKKALEQVSQEVAALANVKKGLE